MGFGTLARLVVLVLSGVAVGGIAGLVCSPALLSARVRSLCRRLGPTPSLSSNYVLLAGLLGVPAALLLAGGAELLAAPERPSSPPARETLRSSLRTGYALLLYVASLVRLAGDEGAAREFHPLDALALFGLAAAYAVVTVGILGAL